MSTNFNLRRLMNEVKGLANNEKANSLYFKIEQAGDNMYHWHGVIYGPDDSLYQGYAFKVDIELPNDYPEKALVIKFVTPIQHVNVNKDGNICMDILKKEWASTLNMTTILISLVSLLNNPNTEDPFNHELAELYKNNKSDYEKKIRYSCKKYGIPKTPNNQPSNQLNGTRITSV